jgi:hypothetical protein
MMQYLWNNVHNVKRSKFLSCSFSRSLLIPFFLFSFLFLRIVRSFQLKSANKRPQTTSSREKDRIATMPTSQELHLRSIARKDAFDILRNTNNSRLSAYASSTLSGSSLIFPSERQLLSRAATFDNHSSGGGRSQQILKDSFSVVSGSLPYSAMSRTITRSSSTAASRNDQSDLTGSFRASASLQTMSADHPYTTEMNHTNSMPFLKD